MPYEQYSEEQNSSPSRWRQHGLQNVGILPHH